MTLYKNVNGKNIEVTPSEEQDFLAFQSSINNPAPAPPVTKRQLRLTLVRNGIPLEAVTAAINAMPDGIAKAEAQIEWEDASYFTRTHPTLLQIAMALNLTENQVDAMWDQAVKT